MTFEEILKRMLSKALESNPLLDIREGSVIYSALAPAAVELQNMYIELVGISNEMFADTATRFCLIKRAAERGITVKAATKAIRKGEFNINVPIGERFSLQTLNYVVMSKISDGVFQLECEIAGEAGNADFGVLIPVNYINGLTTAVLTEVLVPGEDEEETESLRKRYFDSLSSQAFGGNVADYKEKVNALKGVGGVKVYPAWNGGGTVKLVIINSDHEKPSELLIESVQEAIDPKGNQGEGIGIAPIGHVVTVCGVDETGIDIETHIIYQAGWNWEAVKPYLEDCIDSYFKELAKEWEDSENIIIRISQIETRMLNLAGIIDISDTLINGVASNLVLSDSIPIRRSITDG